MFLGGVGQANDEIHTDVFPFPRGNRQWLQDTSSLEMAGFNPLEDIAPSNIPGYFSFHASPLEVLSQVLVHFSTTRMHRDLG
jgi:hypothetical protein